MSDEKNMEIEMNKAVKEVVEEPIARPYILRKLKDSDLFPLLQLLRAVGIKELKENLTEENMKAVSEANKKEGKTDLWGAGKEIFFNIAEKIICSMDTHANEIYAFWSDLSGIPVAEMKEMEFGTLPLMIYDSFSEVKNTAFFKVLSKLL